MTCVTCTQPDGYCPLTGVAVPVVVVPLPVGPCHKNCTSCPPLGWLLTEVIVTVCEFHPVGSALLTEVNPFRRISSATLKALLVVVNVPVPLLVIVQSTMLAEDGGF